MVRTDGEPEPYLVERIKPLRRVRHLSHSSSLLKTFESCEAGFSMLSDGRGHVAFYHRHTRSLTVHGRKGGRVAPSDSVRGADPCDVASIRSEVDAHLAAFLDGKAGDAATYRLPGEVVEVLSSFLFAGGKRIRPVLCVIGWHAAGGAGPAGPVVRAAASLEMFHTFALIHDDIMDDSAVRRGRPTAHHALAAHHPARADAERLGVHAAILLGDLALAWSDEILHTARLTPAQLAAVLPILDDMRTELMYGQYLDLLGSGHGAAGIDTALTAARLKTAKYTVERPLHIGAAISGANAVTLSVLSRYALPVGEAFQLRDDLLGTFGDPRATGKSRLDDLRSGRPTALVSLAVQRADPAQRRTLQTLIGDPSLDEDGADRIREVLIATGAREETERMITDRRRQALEALDASVLAPAVTDALRNLVNLATTRSR
ncbi:polyprenyl synthetase family protein [Streptomyces sp. NBC_01092]|uniref:polyprenyl synthetase family protein n=1 Tax=Streptomyces sp. NBC_01092 TaxID=2903748 RepID=UPI00386E4D0F|nr:polyprenyl synthetase family protein [Streptomyces sp. NBC_01092]